MSTASAHTVEAADEGRHEPGDDRWWSESWYLDFVADDGSIAGYARLGLYANQGVSWWTVAIVGPGRDLVEAVDLRLPLPPAPSDMHVETADTSVACIIEDPLRAMRVVADCPAAVYADPADVYREAPSATTHLALDLVWRTDGQPYHYVHTTRYEIPCLVEGTLTVGDEVFRIVGQGQRDHSWAPRDWWTIDWCWFSARLDDGTRIHGADIRLGPDLRPSFGYTQGGPGPGAGGRGGSERDGDGGDRPGGTVQPIEEGLVVEEVLGEAQLPASATIRCAPVGLDVTVEPIAYGPLRFVDDAGPVARVDHFPRGVARFTAADGRTGFGWIEWNQVQPS